MSAQSRLNVIRVLLKVECREWLSLFLHRAGRPYVVCSDFFKWPIVIVKRKEFEKYIEKTLEI